MAHQGVGFNSLTEDTARAVAGSLISQLSPLYEESDLLQDACRLLAVSKAGAAPLVAGHLLRHLSPRLGKSLSSLGLTHKSTAAEMKAALGVWGLAKTRSKADLWARIQAEASAGGRQRLLLITAGPMY